MSDTLTGTSLVVWRPGHVATGYGVWTKSTNFQKETAESHGTRVPCQRDRRRCHFE